MNHSKYVKWAKGAHACMFKKHKSRADTNLGILKTAQKPQTQSDLLQSPAFILIHGQHFSYEVFGHIADLSVGSKVGEQIGNGDGNEGDE